MLIAPLAGAVADRIGTRPLIAAGLALQAAGLGRARRLRQAAPVAASLPVVMADADV